MPQGSRVRVAVVGALVGVSALGGAVSALAERAQTRYPNSIVVLGHSGATGESSDPRFPGVEIRENSWATGTNPAVKSVYLRILAKNPKIKGHNVNLAQGGATVRKLVLQAKKAVSLSPKPELVLIQIMDNDIVCPATAGDYAAFRATFVSALNVLARGAPSARVFVVSQFGSPTTVAMNFTLAQRKAIGGRTGPCEFLDASGEVVPTALANLEMVIHGYEAQLAAGCKRFAKCRYDGGAFGGIIDRPEDTHDLNHLSVKGHAKAAAVAWAAMKRAGIIPRTG